MTSRSGARERSSRTPLHPAHLTETTTYLLYAAALISTVTRATGAVIVRWVRKVRGVPAYCGKQDIHDEYGETFDAELVTLAEVIAFIEAFMKEIEAEKVIVA